MPIKLSISPHVSTGPDSANLQVLRFLKGPLEDEGGFWGFW